MALEWITNALQGIVPINIPIPSVNSIYWVDAIGHTLRKVMTTNEINISGTEWHLQWIEHKAYVGKEGEFEQVKNGKVVMNFENPGMVLKFYLIDKEKFYNYIWNSELIWSDMHLEILPRLQWIERGVICNRKTNFGSL